jgi:LDH2 family malate/lactate/ureidoglycolate dehydrogenase
MELKLGDARALVVEILTSRGMPTDYAGMVADHLVDGSLVGDEHFGLPRAIGLAEVLEKRPPAGRVAIVREDANSAVIDGCGNNGFVTSVIGIDKAIELARKSGVGVVGVSNTWFSGRLAYYVERAARHGLIAFHTASATARVAPYGGIDPVYGTNPIAFGFPGRDGPLIVDIGTSAATWGEMLHRRSTGRALDPGMAVDRQGHPTDDAAAGLAGAILPWGGARGGGLALVVQVLGLLAGGRPIVKELGDYGFFFLVFDPELLMPLDEFKARSAELLDVVRASRPGPGFERVRVQGEASMARRAEALARGSIVLEHRDYTALQALRRKG